MLRGLLLAPLAVASIGFCYAQKPAPIVSPPSLSSVDYTPPTMCIHSDFRTYSLADLTISYKTSYKWKLPLEKSFEITWPIASYGRFELSFGYELHSKQSDWDVHDWQRQAQIVVTYRFK
jgi:hypothetical protein